MTLAAFAERYRLKVRTDEDGSQVINGRRGKIYLFDVRHLAVLVLNLTPRRWGNARRSGQEVGMRVLQDGDAEGTMLFDPTNPDHAKVAIKVAGVKKKRTMSPEQLAAKTAILDRVNAARRERQQVAPSVSDVHGGGAL